MTAKTKFIIFNLLGLAVAIAVFMSSRDQLSFQLFGMAINSSPGLLIFVSYAIGALIGACSMVPFISGKQEENVAKLKAWQQQDAKLAIEVQADKERLLEAKIATLEAALQKALKRD